MTRRLRARPWWLAAALVGIAASSSLSWGSLSWAQGPQGSVPPPGPDDPASPDPASPDPSATPDPSASAAASTDPAASAPAVPVATKKKKKEKDDDKSTKVLESCRESIPDGATRPTLSAQVEPSRGTSGHVVWLVVTVQHGPGEQLLPEGFVVTGGSDAVEVLEDAFWFIPDPRGGQKTVIEGPTDEDRASKSTVESKARIPFVPLPEDPGTNQLHLPPIPIAVARANGQVMTLCTQPTDVVIDDPIVNEVAPEVHPNPPPRPQRERWEGLVSTLRLLAVLLPLALGAAAFFVWWLRRPKPAPPKPQIPPWITAMRELDEVRRSTWLDEDKLNEYFDRVDHITRFYLGERYGFDGLESTSPEIRRALARVYPPLTDPDRVHKFLEESDFVKYAEVTPTREDCIQAIERAESIVRATKPRAPDPVKKKSARAA